MSCRLVPPLLKTWDTDVANNLSPGEDGMYTQYWAPSVMLE